MKWRRHATGYTFLNWAVGRTQTNEWWAEGPGVDAVFPTKRAAQAACERVYELLPKP